MTNFAADELLQVLQGKQEALRQVRARLQDLDLISLLDMRVNALNQLIRLRKLSLIISDNSAERAAREIILHDAKVSDVDREKAITSAGAVSIYSLLRRSLPGTSYKNPPHSQAFGFAELAGEFIEYFHFNKVTRKLELFPNHIKEHVFRLRVGNYVNENEMFAALEGVLTRGIETNGDAAKKRINARLLEVNRIEKILLKRCAGRAPIPGAENTTFVDGTIKKLMVKEIYEKRRKALVAIIDTAMASLPAPLGVDGFYAKTFKAVVMDYLEHMTLSLEHTGLQGLRVFHFMQHQIQLLAEVVKVLGNMRLDYELIKSKKGEPVSSSKAKLFQNIEDKFAGWIANLENDSVENIVKQKIVSFLNANANQADGDCREVFLIAAEAIEKLCAPKGVAVPKPVIASSKPVVTANKSQSDSKSKVGAATAPTKTAASLNTLYLKSDVPKVVPAAQAALPQAAPIQAAAQVKKPSDQAGQAPVSVTHYGLTKTLSNQNKEAKTGATDPKVAVPKDKRPTCGYRSCY